MFFAKRHCLTQTLRESPQPKNAILFGLFIKPVGILENLRISPVISPDCQNKFRCVFFEKIPATAEKRF